jgi:hypothetical protein
MKTLIYLIAELVLAIAASLSFALALGLFTGGI